MKTSGNIPDNCGDTKTGINKLNRWLNIADVRQWDVIHFNWGLHDLKRMTPSMGVNSNDPTKPAQVSISEYKANLAILVKRLQETGARLIFATTTPYPDGVIPSRMPEDAELYNNAAIEVMSVNSVKVNDLYHYIKPKLNALQRPQNVHFNPEGSEYLAKRIAAVVEASLK